MAKVPVVMAVHAMEDGMRGVLWIMGEFWRIRGDMEIEMETEVIQWLQGLGLRC